MVKFEGMKAKYCEGELFAIERDNNLVDWYWAIPNYGDMYFLFGARDDEHTVEENMQYFIENGAFKSYIMTIIDRLIEKCESTGLGDLELLKELLEKIDNEE